MSQTSDNIGRHIGLGILAILLLVGGFGGWSAYASLAGAVIGTGRVVVDSNVKHIQHPYGGIVEEIAVDDGDLVKAGDILFRLDETITRAELSIVDTRLEELEARRARLEAERDGLGEIVARAADETAPGAEIGSAAETVSDAILSERRVFATRQESREGEISQLHERISQLSEEGRGLQFQIDAKATEFDLVEQELADLSGLLEQGLVQASRITALKRDGARLRGEHGALVSTAARTKGQSSEIELQILQIGQDMQTEIAAELRDVNSELSELVERKVSAEDRLKRVDVFAPIDGVIHESAVHTIGGVVRTADTVMKIVPAGDDLTIEARVAPQNIDQIGLGQEAIVRMTAFNQQTTPELRGTVERVAGNSSEDERTGAAYFTVRIALAQDEIDRLGGLVLMPGMPVETFIQTSERTALNYFIKPLSDQFRHALREE